MARLDDRGLAPYVVEKGSITVDGISLTVVAVGKPVRGRLIPHTLKRTTLGHKQPGETVNLEVDGDRRRCGEADER